jgi:hypothetical protein
MKDSKIDQTDLRSNRDLDTVLKSFFRSEMASPWPMWQAPKQHTVVLAPNKTAGSSSMRSYLALAASIALMICSFLFVSDKLHNAGPRDPNGDNIGFKPLIKENLRQNGEGPTQLEIRLQERENIDH